MSEQQMQDGVNAMIERAANAYTYTALDAHHGIKALAATGETSTHFAERFRQRVPMIDQRPATSFVTHGPTVDLSDDYCPPSLDWTDLLADGHYPDEDDQ